MKVKVSEASGSVLDWMVTQVEGHKPHHYAYCKKVVAVEGGMFPFNYSTDWAQGGPIIEREGISWHCGNKTSWHAYAYGSAENISGPTPLVAAMRCYVASKLGVEAEVPEELQ
jgi:hypothetical protein